MDKIYKVIYSGEIKDGFNFIKVEESFAKLFKINPEKASNYLVPHRVIKKDITLQMANMYKHKLENIGLNVEIECEKSTISVDSLVLEPIGESYADIFTASNSGHQHKEAQQESMHVEGGNHFQPSLGMNLSTNSEGEENKIQHPSSQVESQSEYRIPYQTFISPEDLNEQIVPVVEPKNKKLNVAMFIVCILGIVSGLGFFLMNTGII